MIRWRTVETATGETARRVVSRRDRSKTLPPLPTRPMKRKHALQRLGRGSVLPWRDTARVYGVDGCPRGNLRPEKHRFVSHKNERGPCAHAIYLRGGGRTPDSCHKAITLLL
ncbi:hypothetical protein AAFF_G00213590 [Aldrovandia affinis]|uniref:Uncharacterized protein n=1 Tax=Aldrovandia affinis TaxID=143900 RepID=A0AAD7RGI2_9TELE|nr:hypothetical protein AAFF_G00213590 [Aldrovandia affinis]